MDPPKSDPHELAPPVGWKASVAAAAEDQIAPEVPIVDDEVC